MTALYFANQLRGYRGVLGVLEACNQDICRAGCSLPSVVKSVVKRLDKLQKDLDTAQVVEVKKRIIQAQIRKFVAKAQSLPRDMGKPCQKTIGTCKIGGGCFVSGALKMLKLITEPLPPLQ
jgi:hypothetical protein